MQVFDLISLFTNHGSKGAKSRQSLPKRKITLPLVLQLSEGPQQSCWSTSVWVLQPITVIPWQHDNANTLQPGAFKWWELLANYNVTLFWYFHRGNKIIQEMRTLPAHPSKEQSEWPPLTITALQREYRDIELVEENRNNVGILNMLNCLQGWIKDDHDGGLHTDCSTETCWGKSSFNHRFLQTAFINWFDPQL